MLIQVCDIISAETARWWLRILMVARELEIVNDFEVCQLEGFLMNRWHMYSPNAINLLIDRLHEINRLTKDTLRAKMQKASLDGQIAINAIKRAIETQKAEEKKAKLALQELEAIQAQLQRIQRLNP